MQKYYDVVQNKLGLVVEGAKVLVTDSNGSVASIYSNNATTPTPQTNPMTTDALGRFSFYAADGRYNLKVTIDNVDYGEVRDILLNDPADPSAERIDNGIITNSQVSDSEINDSAITGGTAHQVLISGSTISDSELEGVTVGGLAIMTVGGQAHQALQKVDNNLTAQARQALTRSYAEAGLNIVSGSFESGGTVTASTDALIFEQTGVAYCWGGSLPKSVTPNSTPESSGGVSPVAWVPKYDKLLRKEFSEKYGTGLVGGPLYADIASYSGDANRLALYGGLAAGDGGEGVVIRDPSDTTSPAVTGMVFVDALGRRWKREYHGDVMASWFLIKGDKVTDDTTRFVEAAAFCKANKKHLDISDLKIVLRTLAASINLDDWRIVGNGVPLILPTLHLDYLNGANQADAVWMQEADFIGSAIYCPANIAIFTGKTLNINDVLLVGDYNKANNHAFYQSAPTAYPGWSRALEGASCTIHYFGAYGIYLLGGLEVCNPKNIKIAFTKQNNLRVDGLNTSINCPIEYLYFDESNYFMYSKINNVLINGMRKDVEFAPKLLLNGPGQLDVVKHFNPSFSLSNIGEAWAAVSVVAAPAGTYGGLVHSSSYGLVFSGYAEACQNLLTVSNGFLNDVEMNDTVMYVVDPTWPKAQLITYNAISKIATKGNKLQDGKFYYWLDTPTRNALVALEIGEEALGAAVNVGNVVDPNKKIIPNFNGPWLQLGSGAGGDARFDLDNYFPIVTPVGASAKPIMLLVTSNFGTTAAPSMGAYIVIASRHASNSWVGIVMPSGNNSGFVSQPVVSADGQLSMNLAAGYYASVTRVDGIALT